MVSLSRLEQVKRVIQGEAAGDLVLEEDLKTGGGGIPIGQEGAGAGLDGLEGKRGKGPGPYVSEVRGSGAFYFFVLSWDLTMV